MPIESDKYIDFKNGSYLCVGRGNGKSLRQMETVLDWISEHPDGKIIMPRKSGHTYSMKEAARILSDIPHVKKSHKDFIDALFYGIQDNVFDLIRKGEQKMGNSIDTLKASVNGGLYCRDEYGNFVKVMTVTNIETTNTYDWDGKVTGMKVDGYAVSNAEKIVAYNVREENETEKSRRAMKTLLNQVYGRSLPVATYIDKVIFDNPATVILWKDGTKTVVHAQDGEPYDKEKGFAMAVCKKIFGNERDYYHVFKRWFRKGEDRSKK